MVAASIFLSSNGTYLPKYNKLALILTAFLIVYLGFRPITSKYGLADTINYATFFHLAQTIGPEVLAYKDPGFMFVITSMLETTVSLFFTVCLALYLVPYVCAYKRFFDDKFGFAVIVMICSFGFFGYAVNGIRNGIAFSFVTLAFAQRKYIPMILFALIGLSFHKSVVLPIAAFCITLLYNKKSTYLNIWIASALLSMMFANVVAQFIPADFLGDDRLSTYMNANFQDQVNASFSYVGFRYDFLIYSAIPIIIGWKYLNGDGWSNVWYERIYNTYILCNSFWLFTAYVPYNNRFAFLSWFLYPILVTYPYIQNTDELDTKLKNVLGLSYLFMFLMWIKDFK